MSTDNEIDDEESAQEAIVEEVRAFPMQLEETFPEALFGDVSEAAYTFSERGLFFDDITVRGHEQMIQIWAIVETIRKDGGFPSDLRM